MLRGECMELPCTRQRHVPNSRRSPSQKRPGPRPFGSWRPSLKSQTCNLNPVYLNVWPSGVFASIRPSGVARPCRNALFVPWLSTLVRHRGGAGLSAVLTGRPGDWLRVLPLALEGKPAGSLLDPRGVRPLIIAAGDASAREGPAGAHGFHAPSAVAVLGSGTRCGPPGGISHSDL
ncbi:unnamed protein product [Rangifer tarandus platyrhynchus]|uniref:Uncharacterized protein n=2 Tax=Rangifer tarandus platyrhynchus TaxID=3082113 RepID=A0ABN8ZDG2_RANTA|nr:unnamed protein product [Rangifer tarandus platyrhynchus]CAI9707646.1 unnamed protein product [Rangifer tarandus platyrhynchus]